MEQIPDSSISITLIFPAINTDSENDSSSEFNETSPRFSHNSNSVVLLFPPLRSAPDSPENSEIRITSCPILEIFPPTISETETNDSCSESNQSPGAQFSSWSPFPPTNSETETNDSCSESNQSPRAQFSFSSLFPPVRSETDSSTSNNYEIIIDQILPTPNLRIFIFTELKVATKNFSPDTIIGEGRFGQVFKGWLKDKRQSMSGNRMVITVKKLNFKSLQGFQKWQSLVNFLGRLSHPNLIKLLGYCWEDGELLLIYEFMQKGSLENHLFGSGSAIQPLPWDIRLKIAIGAARGLAFLHTSDMQVIHRNFKSSNILLDGSYTAKISDFGLAKLDPSASQSYVKTQVMGTYAHEAPEYVATGHLYDKSDVYGFGVVLAEILTGLPAIDTKRPSQKCRLVDWIKPSLSVKGKLKQIMDYRLEGKYPPKAAFLISRLALECLAAEPKLRPSMKKVLEILEKLE